MEMKCSNDVPRQLCEIHVERNMRVLKRSFQGMQTLLGPGDSIEETNKFVRDGVFMEQGDLFDCVEDNGGFEDGSIVLHTLRPPWYSFSFSCSYP